jgi:subtilisin
MSFRNAGLRLFIMAALSLLLVGQLTVAAETAVHVPLTDPNHSPLAFPDLAEKVRQEGEINIIVGLALPDNFIAEGELSVANRTRQRGQIAQAGQGLLAELQGYNAEAYHIYETIPAMALRLDEAAFRIVLRSQWVNHIQEDEAVPHTLASSTPVIGAPAVWAQGYDGTGQAVVVLDTGIDGDHPFFEDADNNSRIVAEACFSNANGAGGQTTLCPGGGNQQLGAGASEADSTQCWNGASQLCNHGTHVAGIAAGNGATFDGVARNANIISIQVFTRFNAAANCNPNPAPCVMSYNSDQLAALDYVYNTLRGTHTIASVNMSLGGGGPFIAHCDANMIKPAIDNLRSVGIATIIATGNNSWTNGISSPACISTAIAVSSTTDGDAVSSFANVHDIMDLFAPGSSIESAVVNGFTTYNGTSLATPHVAGAWAVLKQASPTASVDDILDVLVNTGVSVTDDRVGGTYTKPRIQLDAALGVTLANEWTGADDTDWHNTANWSNGNIPTCATNATIPDSLTNYPTITADATARNLVLQSGAELNMSDHTLTLCRSLDVQGMANFNMSGGTLLFGGMPNATVNLPASNKQMHHVQIGNGTNPKQVTLNSDIEIAGNLTISDEATLDSNGQEIRFNGATQAVNIAGTGTPQTIYSADFSVWTGWTVNDANGDGFTWGATSITNAPNSPNTGQHVRYSWNTNATTPANDWLFSPSFTLEAGQTYHISFNYGARSSLYPERLAVYIGNNNSIAAMTTQLFNNNNIVNTNWVEGGGVFVAPTSGTYHIGFHAYSLADQWELAVDDLLVAKPVALFDDWVIENGATVNLSSNLPVVVDNILQVDNDGALNLAGTPLAVNGSVINNGTLQDMLNTPDATTTHFLHIQNDDGSTTQYRGVEITPSGNMGDTTVEIRGNQNCTTDNTSQPVQRCFDIAPGTAQTAAIKFWYLDGEANANTAAGVRVFRWNNPGWQPIGVHPTDYSYDDSVPGYLGVQVTGVSQYSPFVLDDSVTPTAVSLSSLTTGNFSATTGGLLLALVSLTGMTFLVWRKRRG